MEPRDGVQRSVYVLGVAAFVFVLLVIAAFGLFPPERVLFIVLPVILMLADYCVKRMTKLSAWAFGADLAFAGLVLSASMLARGLAGSDPFGNRLVAGLLARCGVSGFLWFASVGFVSVEVGTESPVFEVFALVSADWARAGSVLLGIASYVVQQMFVVGTLG
jgi:hypothetical protein